MKETKEEKNGIFVKQLAYL